MAWQRNKCGIIPVPLCAMRHVAVINGGKRGRPEWRAGGNQRGLPAVARKPTKPNDASVKISIEQYSRGIMQ